MSPDPFILMYSRTSDSVQPLKSKVGSIGVDIAVSSSVNIRPGGYAEVGTGICINLKQHHAIIKERSSSARYGIFVLGGVLDSDYTKEIFMVLGNISAHTFVARPGEYLAQIIVLNENEVTCLETDMERVDVGSRPSKLPEDK